jgi:hypothetical protein
MLNLPKAGRDPNVVFVVLSYYYLSRININGNTFLCFDLLLLFLKTTLRKALPSLITNLDSLILQFAYSFFVDNP